MVWYVTGTCGSHLKKGTNNIYCCKGWITYLAPCSHSHDKSERAGEEILLMCMEMVFIHVCPLAVSDEMLG